MLRRLDILDIKWGDGLETHTAMSLQICDKAFPSG
jgi:hypothetical protein